jgi:hypothetical protein
MGTDYSSTVTYGGSAGSDAAAAGIMAVFAGMFMVILVVVLVIYVFMAVCLMKIAKKTNNPNGWFAWIPILNIVLMLQIAKKPVWWIVLIFIPFVNFVWIVLQILVWMAISRECGKEEWLGILMLVPVVNLFVPAYLAFSGNGVAPVQPAPPVPPVQPAV